MKGEYFTELRELHKSTNGKKLRKVQKRDVVTVFGEGEKRCKQKLPVVEELIVGKYKEVKGAKVRVAGVFSLENRPISLFRFEISCQLC